MPVSHVKGPSHIFRSPTTPSATRIPRQRWKQKSRVRTPGHCDPQAVAAQNPSPGRVSQHAMRVVVGMRPIRCPRSSVRPLMRETYRSHSRGRGCCDVEARCLFPAACPSIPPTLFAHQKAQRHRVTSLLQRRRGSAHGVVMYSMLARVYQLHIPWH